MSEAKHTPGPWAVVETPPDREVDYNGDHLIVWPPNGIPLAKLEHYAVDERRANARLIAAAPDLLQAAEQFLASCKDGNASDLLDYYQDIFAEAVKKAGGVQ